MNTRLRLTALAAVFAFLTPTPSALQARMLAPLGIEVPEGTRKCIKPADRVPVLTDLFVPLACSAPVVNVSVTAGNQSESFVVVNPTNTSNLVAFSNTTSNSIFRAYSTDGGATWTRGTVATGVACCDAQAAWDTFGNLFLVYINASVNQINVILSTDGGMTFSAPVTAGTGSVDQPSIAVGNGSVWVDWNSGGSMVARGAPVTGLGTWGPFNALQTIPSASGSFGGIAVGPGPGGGKVIVTYQSPTGGQGPSTIYVNADVDGLGAGGFGARVTVTTTNVGGFDFIPAQNGRSIDAEAGLVWDATGGPFNNRIYLVYTEETAPENNDTDILMRTSTDDGATWSAPVRVNDDVTTRSQFLPYVTLDRTTGTVAVGFHDARNDTGVVGSGGTNTIPNDDAEYYGTFSTDGGATWAANMRLSGGFSNAAAAANGVDYGDYVGQDAHAGKLYTVWADNSNCDGTNPNGTLHAFDLYTNTLTISSGTPPPTPTATATATQSPTPTATATPTATFTPTPCGSFTENFDGVTAPALPAGWVAANAINPDGILWITSTTTPDTAPNDAFVNDPAVVSDKHLDTPNISINSGTPQVSFRNFYFLESTFDGGVLEVSSPNINGGTFTDITNAAVGGSFVTGGYNATISTAFQSPIAGRMAWSGNGGGYINTMANLGPNVNGQTIKLRFRMASDNSVSQTGWRIDTISLAAGPCGTPSPSPTPTATATATAGSSPTPTATATATATAIQTPTPTPSPTPAAQALNLSTRMLVQTGAEVGIGGFIVTGTAPKRVILRAIGPSLTITGKLADPVMELHGPAGFTTIINDNWRSDQEAEIMATGIPPANDLESAIVATLAPGPYTAIVSGKNGTSGVALVEAYDLAQGAASKLANISTRAFVSTGSNIMIAGFILGNGTAMDNVILRGIGPSLPVTNKLADPTLELRDGNGTLIRSDDNWQDDSAQAALISAAGLAPTNNLESGIAATLSPGQYTALLAGVNNGTGVGLVEVYDQGTP